MTQAPQALDGILLSSRGHTEAAMQAKGAPLCSYLIALAAMQRGLTVRFGV